MSAAFDMSTAPATNPAVVPVLEARGVVKRYGRVVALDRADFDLRPNEILGVIGDNGAGKSTLIKVLAGAVVPDQGQVLMDGKIVQFRSPLEARNAGIETVYQNLALSPALSIADNLFLGRERRKSGPLGDVFRLLDRAQMRKEARQHLNSLGLLTIQKTSTSQWKRSPAASARGSRSCAPRLLAAGSSSWMSRRRRWASRNRARCLS